MLSLRRVMHAAVLGGESPLGRSGDLYDLSLPDALFSGEFCYGVTVFDRPAWSSVPLLCLGAAAARRQMAIGRGGQLHIIPLDCADVRRPRASQVRRSLSCTVGA